MGVSMPGPLNSPTAVNPLSGGASSLILPPNLVCTAAGTPTFATTVVESTSSDNPRITRSLRSMSPPKAIPPRQIIAVIAATTTLPRLFISRPFPSMPRWEGIDVVKLARELRQTRFDPFRSGVDEHGLRRRHLIADADDGVAGGERGIAVDDGERPIDEQSIRRIVIRAVAQRRNPAAIRRGFENGIRFVVFAVGIRGTDQNLGGRP